MTVMREYSRLKTFIDDKGARIINYARQALLNGMYFEDGLYRIRIQSLDLFMEEVFGIPQTTINEIRKHYEEFGNFDA